MTRLRPQLLSVSSLPYDHNNYDNDNNNSKNIYKKKSRSNRQNLRFINCHCHRHFAYRALQRWLLLILLATSTSAALVPYFASTRAQMHKSAKNVLDWPEDQQMDSTAQAQHEIFRSNKLQIPVPPIRRNPNAFNVEATAYRRLVEDILDPAYYEKTVHPRRNFSAPTRVNLSMSLYQILDVEERQQSIMVNVWMVQDWYDEFLDWNPLDYEMINKTIVPYQELWIPDTRLYNAETLEQKRTEALMNVIVETGYWRNDSRGAYVQLMFPAIYTLSCKMNVRFFPYDQQNCSFIISSWTHDSSTIDYYAKNESVNLKNFARNEEWEVISFTFRRIGLYYKCCPRPWIMLYAHLVIRRKPLYYIINLVIPTSIITIVAVTGFFTPSSTSSERDEKLYLGINTLLTMSVMMLMVCNQMPSTSSYVPLMGWYYMVIIFVIVIGTMLATGVLFIHSQKQYAQPLPPWLLRICTNSVVWAIILRPPANLIELWTEYGVISETRIDTADTASHAAPFDSTLIEGGPNDPSDALGLLSSMSSQVSARSAYRYERRIASVTKQYVRQMRERERLERRRRKTLADAMEFVGSGMQPPFSYDNSRTVKKQKMMRRCSMEWEYLANGIDRVLLFIFCMITVVFFIFLVFFDYFFEIE